MTSSQPPGVRRALRVVCVAVLAMLIGVSSLARPDAASAATFSDIGSSPFQHEIEWLVAEGITSGCGDGRYCPRAPVTRAQMASFLVRMYGYSVLPPGNPFVDDDDSIHEEDIERLAAAGITGGCAPERYCPSSPVRRAEMASFLARAERLTFGAGSDHFADDDASIHETNLDRIFFAGIGGACGFERSCPAPSVTREQMAAFLYRTVHADPIGPAGLAEHVVLAQPTRILFDGPRRWRGVDFSADGTTARLQERYGTIPDRAGLADQTARFNGVRYARMASGPLAGWWVKADAAFAAAQGRAPAPPPCSYQDLPTSRTGYDQWATTLLDTTYALPATYAPSDRSSTATAGLNAGYTVRDLVIPDLTTLASGARAAGTPLQVVSAYRTYEQQASTFAYWVGISGYAEALLRSARAGHSEHQLGTTIDFTSLGASAPWNIADWAATPAGAWMAANAWRHGFVMSYPRGETAVTCYAYEPWHYRYVGREMAAAVHGSGMTLREAIWAAHGP